MTSAAAALATVSVAEAGGFALREQSAYGQGSSFAGIAAGGSLSSMFWNNANLSDVEGIEIEQVGTGVFPHTDVELDPVPALAFPGSDEGDIAQNAFVPAGYAAYRFNDRIVLGVGINGPFGLVTKYDGDSILRATGAAGTSKVFSLNVNPALSVDVTDWLAVAVGAQIQYIDVRLTAQRLGADPPAGLGISTLEGDDIGFGLTAGVKVTPMPGTEIGLGYRSRINHELEGTLNTSLPDPPFGDFDIDADGLNLPDLVTLGIRQRITDRFRVMAGAEWSNWSNFDTVDVSGVDLGGGDVPIELPFEYEDGWFFSIGGEYDVTEKVTVRAGVGYELSPIDEDSRTFRLPDNDRLWLSAGASYRHNDRFSFDLGYSFLSAADTDIDASEDFGGDGPDANLFFSGEADSNVHIISAAVKVKFGGPAPGVMEQPIVVKP
jgi:long-chain fatty acid transport protein